MASSKKRSRTATASAPPASGKQGKPPPGKQAPGRPDAFAAGPPVNHLEGMSTSEKIVWISLHVLVFLVPIAISNANWLTHSLRIPGFELPITYDQFDIVKVFVMRACALVGLGAWSFDFFARGGKLRRTRADWLILVVLAWILVTSFTSVHVPTAFFGKYRRFEGFLSFLTYASVFFLTVQIADRPGRIRSLAHTLVVSGTIVATYGVMQYIGLDPIRWVGEGQRLPFEFNRGFSTYGNPDLLGGFLMFPLPISLAMALSDRRRVWKGVYWAVFLICAVAWITAFVRGAWIGGAVALIVVGIMAALAPAVWNRVDWGGAGVAGGATAVVVLRSLTSESDVLNVWERLVSIFKFNEGSALTRFEIWQAALEAIRRKPVQGWGPDTFRLVFPMTKPLEYTRDAGYISVADNVHNYPLQLASAIGIPGALLMYGLFGWVLYLGLPNAFARGKGADRLLITGVWAAALGYIVHLMFGLSVTGSTVFLWLCLALLLAPTARTVEVGVKPWGPAVAVVVTALAAAAFVYNAAYIYADRYYLKSLFAQSLGEDAVTNVEMAIRLNPSNDMYRTQLAEAYRQRMAGWLSEARTQQSKGEDPTDAVNQAAASFQLSENAYRDVIAFVPTEYDNHVFLAALYNQAAPYFGDEYYEKAIEAADVGIAVEPYGPYVRHQKAIALWGLGRTDDVIDVLEETVTMDPNFIDPIALLADAYYQKKLFEEAEPLYRQVLGARPEDEQSRRNIAAVHAALGEWDKALSSYRMLAEKYPEDESVRDAIRSIEASRAASGGAND